MKLFYRLKKKPSNKTGFKSLYMKTWKIWNTEGKFFEPKELLKLLKKYYSQLPGTETFPDDWEIVEYQLIETKEKPLDWFIRINSKEPFIKGL
jgi:hypothetical protein